MQFWADYETNYNRGTTELGDPHEVHRASLPTAADGMAGGEKNLVAEQATSVQAAPLTGTPHTFTQKLRMLNHRYTSYKTLFTMMYRPILLLRFPVVAW